MSKPKTTLEDPTASPDDAVEYESIRIIEGAHKLRYGSGAKLVESKGDQIIRFRSTPFEHFEVQPQGIQIPIGNVASAVPKSASIANRLRKTGQTGGRIVKPVPGVDDE